MNRLSLSALTTVSIALTASVGCADDPMLERTQRNVAAMTSFHGVLVEGGVLASGEMRSEVFYRRPDRFLSRVLSPESYAGVTLAYGQGRLVVFYPKASYAIEIDGLPPVTAESERKLVEHVYRYNQRRFRYQLGGGDTVAKLPVVNLRYTAASKGAPHSSGMVQVYDRYSFSLAGTLRFAGGADYAFRYEDITFNHDVSDSALALTLPKNVILSRWDLASPGVPEPEVRALANFDVVLPRLPDGFALERIVRQEGPVPAFTAVYRRGAAWLLVSMWKDTGLRPTSEAHGVPVALPNGRGHLVTGPSLSSYTVTLHGTMLVLTANLPFDELLQLASTLQ